MTPDVAFFNGQVPVPAAATGRGRAGAVERALRVCVVGKYPPIQGGISAQCYWMCRWLAERGHEIHVVTNADEVETQYRILPVAEDLTSGAPGGTLRVWRTEAPTPAYRHIPQTNPVVTKLASLALEAIETHACDLVVGFYLEPYAVAAHLAATLSGRPLVIRHAGSDVGRLLSVPQLGRTYAAILKSADIVCTRPAARTPFLELGVPESRIVPDPGWVVPREYFHPAVKPLDVNAHLASVGLSPIDPAAPIIGIYGKMGTAKGTFDLLEASIALKRAGLRFTLLAATHGSAEDEARFERTIAAGDLSDRVRQLPFLPHPRVAALLRACSMVCVLEREFPIAGHASGTAIEVLACGTPLMVSAEVARKQIFAPRVVHGRNVLVVRDPRDHGDLARLLSNALDDLSALRLLGMRGERLLAEPVSAAEQIRPYEELFAAAIDKATPRVERGKLRTPPVDSDGEERRSWTALQQPHPAIASTEVLDDLFYRELESGGPHSASIPALAANVVIRPFSRDMEAEGDLSPCAYAFQHLPFRERARIVRLGVGHYLVSSLANGARSLCEIADAIGPTHDGTVQKVCEAARDLFDEGIILFLDSKGVQTWQPTISPKHRRKTH
jgi:glycosyltransferase involved in cell wall biosynthesis